MRSILQRSTLQVLCLAPLLLSACGGRPEYSGPYKHVILITMDTTRADHLSCYGAPAGATPHLDALAAQGTRFADVTTPAPTTLAAHTSIMTGSWPHTHGVVRNGFTVNEQNRMLAELLHEAGFHTAAFLGSFALESRFHFDQGFDHFDEDFTILFGDGTADQNQRRGEDVTAAALRYVARVKDDVPRLFLFLHYFDPHQPYAPPPSAQGPRTDLRDVERAVRAHQEALIGEAYGSARVINEGLPLALVGAADGSSLPEDGILSAAYAAEVSYMDRCLGTLFEGLEKEGILDEAVVVVLADHGETMQEHHDFWNHGLWLYQTTVHVPLIMRLPDGRGAGRVVETPVSSIDVLPTLCDLLGLEVPPRCEGTSLLACLDGESLERGPIFSEATQPGPRSGLEREGSWGNLFKPRAVRRGPWKLIVSPYHQVPAGTGKGTRALSQLFNLDDDPGETHDLLRDGGADTRIQAITSELAGLLLAWQKKARPLPSHFDRSQFDETQRRLKEMGYAGEDE